MRPFKIVDVFSDVPFKGNPVAVVLDGSGLTTEEMQAIAAWTNLSETTFALPATVKEADYRLRIFTPRSELPFAGHPTLGSAHALLEAGIVRARDGGLVQECGVGLITVKVDGERLEFEMPQAALRDLTDDEGDTLVSILGHDLASGCRPALVDVGARWVVAELPDATTLKALTPDLAASARFESSIKATGLSVFGRYPDNTSQIEVRSFAPSCGINEDPVCGSGNGAIAAFRLDRKEVSPGHTYIATQGGNVGRSGHVELTISASRKILVSGKCVTTVNGDIAG